MKDLFEIGQASLVLQPSRTIYTSVHIYNSAYFLRDIRSRLDISLKEQPARNMYKKERGNPSMPVKATACQ